MAKIDYGKLTELMERLDERLHNAFLRETADGDCDWTDRITNEQYNVLTDISLFFGNIIEEKELPIDFGMFKNHSFYRFDGFKKKKNKK